MFQVNLAAQTLSASVADAIEFLAEDLMLEEFKGAQATIKFIRMFDRLFDLLNSRNPFGRGMKTPMRSDNEQYWKPFLDNAVHYIMHLTNTSGTLLCKTSRKVPFLGFAISSLSLSQIYKDQVLEDRNLNYILTYKFSQDHLELFFCSVRYVIISEILPKYLSIQFNWFQVKKWLEQQPKLLAIYEDIQEATITPGGEEKHRELHSARPNKYFDC